MRSGSPVAVRRGFKTGTALLCAAGLVAGCTTTQHEAQRVQLDSARGRAAAVSTRVTVPDPLIRSSVTTVAQGSKTAFVVTVRNAGRRGVTDLPISVGYSLAGEGRVYLNAEAGLPYFEAHLPAVFPGHPRVWIYTAQRSLPTGARPFALIGAKPAVRALLTETDIPIDTRWRSAGTGPVLKVRLDNTSSVPQYQLQLYAYGLRGGRVVAAGNTTLTDLGAGSTQRVRLPLLGTIDGARLRVEVVPTILQ